MSNIKCSICGETIVLPRKLVYKGIMSNLSYICHLNYENINLMTPEAKEMFQHMQKLGRKSHLVHYSDEDWGSDRWEEILSTTEHTDENLDEGWTWGVVPTCGYL